MLRPLSLLLLLVLPLPFSASQGAPGAMSFSATLDSIKINARPAQVVTRQFRLTLDPGQPVTQFAARVEDWWRSEDGKQSFYAAPGTLARSCARWVSVNPAESAVVPGGTLTVRITASIPAELSSGGFWCVLTVDQLPDPLADSAGVGVRFVASVSTGIFIYVDPVTRDAEILDLDVTADEAVVRVRNRGNAPLGIDGRIEFYAAGASTPAAIAHLGHGTLLTEPSPEGLFGAALPSSTNLPAGNYRARAILDFGGDHYIGAERDLVVDRGAARP